MGLQEKEKIELIRERIHYLCLEVTIWTSEYWNSFVLQTASNRLKLLIRLLGFHFKIFNPGLDLVLKD